MGQRTCYSCAGRGGQYRSQSVPNYGTGPVVNQIQVWESCGGCGGTGTVYEYDPLPTVTPGGGGGGRTPKPPRKPDTRTPEQRARDFEDGLAGLIFLAVWIAVSWAGIAEARSRTGSVEKTWYIFIGIGFVAGAATSWVLRKPLRPLLVFLRKAIVFTIYAGLIGGALYVGSRMFADPRAATDATTQPTAAVTVEP
jgi:hypothetical protein